MEQVRLGNTGLTVSRLCYGTLTLGPLQAALPVEEGAQLLCCAIERGVNFVDTAQLYETYPYIRRAMEISGERDIIISTKTYAHTRELAAAALEEARQELNRDYIDIFLLHEQESEHTLRGHRDALEYLLEQKQKGIIRAVGLSSHMVAGVDAAISAKLDIIHPLLNLTGLGICDGTREDMQVAVNQAYDAGMGIFSMKALGGGNLFRQAEKCLEYAISLPYVHSVAVGMQSQGEVDANIDFFEGKGFSPAAKTALQNKTRRLHIESWCEGCGACVSRCGQSALHLDKQGMAVCEESKCLLCGYCGAVCPDIAIKII
ncbi:MAG: aldo/keto reductase [Oscillospiraceae bacterium]|nr:aldo/keto reductase [Oscillospiraceae bacterium]